MNGEKIYKFVVEMHIQIWVANDVGKCAGRLGHRALGFGRVIYWLL